MASGSRQLTRVALPVVAPGKDARCLDMGQIYCVLSSQQLGDAFTPFTAAAVLEDSLYLVHTRPIGLRLLPTAEIRFDDVGVPASAVLGEVNFLTTFNVSRLGNASELLGIGRRAIAQAAHYGRDRQVGDSKVVDFQGI